MSLALASAARLAAGISRILRMAPGALVVEMLGAERLVYGRLGGAPFTLRLDGTLPAPRPGETLPIRPAGGRLHWFDASSQARL